MTEHSDHPFETDQLATAGAPDVLVVHPPLKLDVSRYMHLIDPSIPEHQQRQMIEALWPIMIALVDLGIGIHPFQQACGQVSKALASGDGTDSDGARVAPSTLSQTFNKAAARRRRRERKTP